MKNSTIIALLVVIVASFTVIVQQDNQLNKLDEYRSYLSSISTIQDRLYCKETEDPYFFVFNSIGSTSPKLHQIEKNIIEIGSICVNRITQEDGAFKALTLYDPKLLKPVGFFQNLFLTSNNNEK